ncbi:unnamed protein product [Rodentolepis nana]|uniref:DUF294_C domain-containing protein n=1 Tax=Rodentolepis nana TaxID=102285 RepID=A0A0R3T703_RODNA|nr:unnamed protein product [Rodentolepis nana]
MKGSMSKLGCPYEQYKSLLEESDYILDIYERSRTDESKYPLGFMKYVYERLLRSINGFVNKAGILQSQLSHFDPSIRLRSSAIDGDFSIPCGEALQKLHKSIGRLEGYRDKIDTLIHK